MSQKSLKLPRREATVSYICLLHRFKYFTLEISIYTELNMERIEGAAFVKFCFPKTFCLKSTDIGFIIFQIGTDSSRQTLGIETKDFMILF